MATEVNPIGMIEFWDLGSGGPISINSDSIQRFAPVSSRQGSNIFLKSGPSIWVQEDYKTVKSMIAKAEERGKPEP